jgi:hypothetical protein
VLFPIARLFFLSWMESPCIINVKTSAVFKVGILQCTTVDLFQISALLFSILYCNFINTLYKLWRNISNIKFNPLVWPYSWWVMSLLMKTSSICFWISMWIISVDSEYNWWWTLVFRWVWRYCYLYVFYKFLLSMMPVCI